MKSLLLLLIVIPMQVSGPENTSENVILRRIESVFQLRNVIMEKAWPGAGQPKFDIPFIYYTDSTCYVANPTDRFLKKYKCELKQQTKKLRIYRMTERIDSFPFHMECMLSDNESDFNYLMPYGQISGFDEVRKYAPQLSVREWTGMVLHEFFHGYQFLHEQFWKYALEKKLSIRAINDSLQSYYKNFDWYKKSVDQENELLLQAIVEKDNDTRKKLATKMLALRDERRKLAEDKFERPVSFFESGFETMEGTARYIEAATIENFQTVKFSDELLKIDSNYRNALIKHESVYAESGYKTEATMLYTYAIGYNMARLLDKFGNNYKSKLFKQPELTLEKLLREEVAEN